MCVHLHMCIQYVYCKHCLGVSTNELRGAYFWIDLHRVALPDTQNIQRLLLKVFLWNIVQSLQILPQLLMLPDSGEGMRCFPQLVFPQNVLHLIHNQNIRQKPTWKWNFPHGCSVCIVYLLEAKFVYSVLIPGCCGPWWSKALYWASTVPPHTLWGGT